MKIVHLTSVHPALDSRIFYKEAATLAAAGYEVVLVAVAEHDASMQGVRIRAVTARATRRWHRITLAVLAVMRSAWAERAALYHFHDPELIPLGIILKAARRRVIYDVHEDVPRQIMSKYWIPTSLRRSVATSVAALEMVGARLFDGVVAATPAIAKRFPMDKAVVVQNFPILSEFAAVSTDRHADREAAVAYVGGLTAVRGAREMVEAMAALPSECGVKLYIAGTFAEPGLEAQCSAMPGWAQIEHLGWQSREEVAALLSRVRAGLVILRPTPNHVEAYPIKLFEYMAAGLPVIASDFPLWREIVEGAGCGLLVDPLDPPIVANAIRWIIDHPEDAESMGRRGQHAVARRYNWDREAKKLLASYQRLLT